jgi:hypothetical protein
MAMTCFRKMTKRQAATALAEYLAERPVALQRLRDELAAGDLDPDTLLDGTPESLTPLWRWVATRIMTMEDNPIPFDPDAPAPTWWPSPNSPPSCAVRSRRSQWWENHSWKSARRTGSSTSGCTRR